MIHRNIELEAKLIDDLLDLNRVARGKLELQLKAVDAVSVIDHVLDLLEEELLAGRFSVIRDLPRDCPRVLADFNRLEQVLWNLIRNATKFTPAGGAIAIRARDAKARVYLEVSDTGMGIDPSDLERIFLPFEQTSGAVQARRGGLGLGLALARGLVESMGGALVAESPGTDQGSTFRLDLPIAAGSTVADAAAARAARASSRDRTKTILFVEDDQDTREVLSSMLRSDGYKVAEASDVHSALQIVERGNIDVVISDLRLPDGSGLDLMRALLARGGTTPKGIALSGYGMEQDLKNSLDAGFAVHLTKPIALTTLEDAIRHVAA
jgi:CheY-like chemotaxis protein